MKKSQLMPACRLSQGSAPPGSEPGARAAATAPGGECGVPVDLREEGANMLRLVQSQQEAQTPLASSSRQAQLVLGQF
ncbi:hypothetical protein [Geomonas anaerohicana]|uniref:Uncharacterized protein n=1 Tax=Geomonas anaerohicana TaxID=2798583 RepID=A0ABS0YBY9_9BACT|nr:hypothetical protein [Geomonas anaerohicana]MBJ6749801.1 hypothetical protein [Geomonas anaerohicana]